MQAFLPQTFLFFPLATALLITASAHSQESPPPSLPDLSELPTLMPSQPGPDSTLVPATPSDPTPTRPPAPSPASTRPSPEQLQAAQAERNWAVEAVKAKQEEAARAAAEAESVPAILPGQTADELTRALDPLTDLRESAEQPRSTSGELGNFQPVIGTSPGRTEPATTQNPVAPSANPLTSTPSAPVRPLIGPPPTPEMTLPTHGRSQPPNPNTVKLSSDPNFLPEGFADPLTRWEEEQAAAQARAAQTTQTLRTDEPRRPTYQELRRRIPDPTDRPRF